MADDDKTSELPATSLPAGEPEWAVSLRRVIEELPGKLSASVTDDDKNGIAETVHGLFERSGAFQREEETKQEKKKPADDTQRKDTETEPHRGGRFSKFAGWFAGE